MTHGSTSSRNETGFRERESEHRGEPRGWAGVSTHALADRPRMLRPGEREPAWAVATFDLEVPRSVVLEAANDIRDALGWREDEAIFFLVDVDGGVQLCVRGRAAGLHLVDQIRDGLADWHEELG